MPVRPAEFPSRSGVYRIVCVPTGEEYVGATIDFAARWSFHKSKGAVGKLRSVLRKYGKQALRFEILEECGVDRLNYRERVWYFKLRPALNGVAPSLKTSRAKTDWVKLSKQEDRTERRLEERRKKLAALPA